jgi:Kef-type K+ transport system membrane component KefB
VISKLVGSGFAAAPLGLRSAMIIGVGMVPRGEVGVIIAGSALAAGAIQQKDYSLLVLMSIITTIIAPPALRLLLQGVPRAPTPETHESSLIAVDEAGLH